MKLPNNYPLYETAYGSGFPAQQLFMENYQILPSIHYERLKIFSKDIINYLVDVEKFAINANSSELRRSGKLASDKFLINDSKQIYIVSRQYRDTDFITLTYYYNISNGDLKTQINFDEFVKYDKTKDKENNIFLVKSEMGHLDLEEYELKVPEMDLELNYGENFIHVHEKIIAKLNTNKEKGIVLLDGMPGTGKTTYIKYLSSLVTKDVLFIPPSMAEMLSEPSIIPFLMNNQNTVLVIEDAERIISSRESSTSSSAGVSNLLNITDGILGDCLNIQVIATFNTSRENIDKALLRKGRLIAEHNFKELSIKNTNKLLKHIGKNQISEKPMILSDIYNIDEELLKSFDNNKEISFL